MPGDYDKNTTYLVFTHDNAFNGNETVEDLNGNVYILNDRFPYNATLNPFYTYSNNIKNLNDIDFYWDKGQLPTPPFNNNFTKVILGENVTSIGEHAFLGCFNLQIVYIVADNKLGIPSPATNVYFFGATVNTKLPTITVGGTYTLTSSGTDTISNGAFAVDSPESTGNVVTASSTFTASASCINTDDANKSLIKHVCEQFILPKVNDFSSKYRNDSYNLTFTHK